MNIKYDNLDRLFSKYIRVRDKCCQVCGQSNKRLEAAHIFGRGQKSVRFDPENCWAMCGGPNQSSCHRYMDLHTTEKMEWCRKKIGDERFNRLSVRARTPKKPDRVLIKIWLDHELTKLDPQ